MGHYNLVSFAKDLRSGRPRSTITQKNYDTILTKVETPPLSMTAAPLSIDAICCNSTKN
jgi:hypothetical protein